MPRSLARGMIFSMPMQAMWIGGRLVPMSALPSLVQTTTPPVSAMAKLTPVSPACAARNFWRRWPRAASVRYLGSEAPFVGSEFLMEELADVLLLEVNGGEDDVAGRFVAELHDAFAEIGVRHLDAARLQVRIEVALLGQHRLGLHQAGNAALGRGCDGQWRCARRRRAPSGPGYRWRWRCARTPPGNRRGARACAA